ncbi:tetratricopeptide repeat protein [Acidicapsa dinghuensis]|uniref:Tetratricopeptide repeat protein n=1 Tax=Acidicapsa dinghuensis TaxID=2218256 RepID=A0ABW1EBJ7_9BACT|nr:hypothetical protein [Acidicapsa dinghuensis]
MKSLPHALFALVLAACGCGQWVGPPPPEEYAKSQKALASKGDTEAAWNLANCYLHGNGVPLDFALAEHWFEIGANTPDKKTHVAQMYASGKGFPKDIEAAAKWFIAAGRPFDFFELAELYKAEAEADHSMAAKYYSKATTIYLDLIRKHQTEVKRSEMELGNFVIDGIYSAGDTPAARAQDLEWARMIAQELLGQKEYQISVEYDIGEEDLPEDQTMRLYYLKRAAAYDVDLALHYYIEALNEGKTKDFSGYDYIAWERIAQGEGGGESRLLKAFIENMSALQLDSVQTAYDNLIATREQCGAYYTADDPLRNVTPAVLAAMDQDDPDVKLREAFNLEKAAATNEHTYQRALALYRDVRNTRGRAPRFILDKYALFGRNGVPQNRMVAEYWLREAIRSGSEPAQDLLSSIGRRPSHNPSSESH